MIKTIDLDKMSKEKRNEIAREISRSNSKIELKEKDVWIKTECAIFKAVDFRFARIITFEVPNKKVWDVLISLGDDEIAVKRDFESFEEAQKYMYDLFDCIN